LWIRGSDIIKNMEKHKRRFVILSVVIFTLAFVLHVGRLVLGWDIVLGEFVVPKTVSLLASVATFFMVWMGVYYARK